MDNEVSAGANDADTEVSDSVVVADVVGSIIRGRRKIVPPGLDNRGGVIVDRARFSIVRRGVSVIVMVLL